MRQVWLSIKDNKIGAIITGSMTCWFTIVATQLIMRGF